MPSRSATRSATTVATHGALVCLCVLVMFPLAWMLSTAFKSPDEIFTTGLRLVPRAPTFGNFPDAFSLQPVGRWFVNSVIVAGAITAAKLAVSLPAAFAFSRMRFPGRNLLFGIVVGTMIVPYVITIVPNYVTIARLGWVDTLQGVIVPSVAFTGFYVFLLRQAMLAIPQELFDAARVDGAGYWMMLTRIAVPLVRPTVAAVTVLAFMAAWNLYLWPLLVLSDVEAKTLSVGLQFFAANEEVGQQQWGPLMATTMLAVLPPLTFYVIAQKRVMRAFIDTTSK